MKYEKIIKIEPKGKKNIYHLTVQKNHNFFGNNICLHNCGYRGEIMVMLFNLGENDVQINHGDRIAQGVVCPVIGSGKLTILEVDQLSETPRGEDGFGSTGIK